MVRIRLYQSLNPKPYQNKLAKNELQRTIDPQPYMLQGALVEPQRTGLGFRGLLGGLGDLVSRHEVEL